MLLSDIARAMLLQGSTLDLWDCFVRPSSLEIPNALRVVSQFECVYMALFRLGRPKRCPRSEGVLSLTIGPYMNESSLDTIFVISQEVVYV
jgi:hypothetical protein